MAENKENLQEETVEETVENTEPTAEEKLTAELNETKDKLLRVMAEYDNFRKRSQKEKEMAYGDTKASTIAEFLPVYDNFERAMSADATDIDSFKKGIEMIFNQYGETFKKLGVESFGEKGDEFDPNIHNAVMHGEDENLPENSISDVFSTGYKMGDRVIRPAIVKVVN
ncbi:MAG: nucleotide exchange factor GrpE [Clostridia bacterium]|nr:nucleotide exchange factor GrpE [Clostridia bacterium]MBR2953319.1 nucleotide exchange factor GrpE [Clostridia bacterium]MBR2953346.1 nucleotide exchange factor GrpE [Clostridia bacterium]